MKNDRLEELLISAIDHAFDVSDECAYDIICAIVCTIGITPDKLEKHGYDRQTFPELYLACEEE